MKRKYKYRLEPTGGQRQLFAQFAGASRFLYNRELAQRISLYEKAGKSIHYYEQNNELVTLKKEEREVYLGGYLTLTFFAKD